MMILIIINRLNEYPFFFFKNFILSRPQVPLPLAILQSCVIPRYLCAHLFCATVFVPSLSTCSNKYFFIISPRLQTCVVIEVVPLIIRNVSSSSLWGGCCSWSCSSCSGSTCCGSEVGHHIVSWQKLHYHTSHILMTNYKRAVRIIHCIQLSL